MKRKRILKKERRKERYRKYIQKKPVFGRLFLSKFLLLFCVVFVLCLAGTLAAEQIYCKWKEEEANSLDEKIYDILSSEVNHKSAQESEDLWKVQKEFALGIQAVHSNAIIRVYNAETKEIYLNPEGKSFAFFREGENRDSTAIYETPAAPWLALCEKYSKEFVDVEFEIQSVYLKEGMFYPGTVQMVEQVIDQTTGEFVVNVLEESDMTPEHPEEYEYRECSEDGWHKTMGPLFWEEKEITEEYREFFEDYVKRGEEAAWDDSAGSVIEDGIYTIPGGILYSSFQNITLFNGLKVTAVFTARYNMFEDYGRVIYAIYAGFFMVALMAAFFWSYRDYMIRLAQYQMGRYRRDTTNAMAHDLKTPLTAISGYAENLRSNLHTEKKEYYADAILDNVQYMNHMVGNILELSKVENAGYRLQKTEVNLEEVTDEILKKQEILVEEKNLEIVIKGSVTVQADRAWMVCAIENLIGNAIKYIPSDGTVFICMEKKYYEVRNVLTEEFDVPVDELWKPFVKGDNSRSDNQGTGIGLTIVKNVADMHGYTLELGKEEDEFVARLQF